MSPTMSHWAAPQRVWLICCQSSQFMLELGQSVSNNCTSVDKNKKDWCRLRQQNLRAEAETIMTLPLFLWESFTLRTCLRLSINTKLQLLHCKILIFRLSKYVSILTMRPSSISTTYLVKSETLGLLFIIFLLYDFIQFVHSS